MALNLWDYERELRKTAKVYEVTAFYAGLCTVALLAATAALIGYNRGAVYVAFVAAWAGLFTVACAIVDFCLSVKADSVKERRRQEFRDRT